MARGFPEGIPMDRSQPFGQGFLKGIPMERSLHYVQGCAEGIPLGRTLADLIRVAILSLWSRLQTLAS